MNNKKINKKIKKYVKPTINKTKIFSRLKKDDSAFINQFLLAADHYLWDAY
jgi:hypothetical protein